MRGAITHLSKDSVARLCFVAANAPDVGLCSMLTMTYHPDAAPRDGRAVKRHVAAALVRLSRQPQAPPLHSYLWFLEFQANGSPHVHVISNVPVPSPTRTVRPGSQQNMAATLAWSEWLASLSGATGEAKDRMTRAACSWERLRTVDGATRYVLKYGASLKQKAVPPGFTLCGRFWGHSRDMRPRPVADYMASAVHVEDAGAAGRNGAPFRVQYGAAGRYDPRGRPTLAFR